MARATEPERPILLYDGDCAFCSACAAAVERRVPTTAEVAPWQRSDLAALGVSQAAAEEAILWVAPGRPVAAGPEAVARLLVDAGSFWGVLGRLLELAPVRWIAWRAYRLIARNRHRLPGGTPTCSLPAAERPSARSR